MAFTFKTTTLQSTGPKGVQSISSWVCVLFTNGSPDQLKSLSMCYSIVWWHYCVSTIGKKYKFRIWSHTAIILPAIMSSILGTHGIWLLWCMMEWKFLQWNYTITAKSFLGSVSNNFGSTPNYPHHAVMPSFAVNASTDSRKRLVPFWCAIKWWPLFAKNIFTSN